MKSKLPLNYSRENLYLQKIGHTCPICQRPLIEFDERSIENAEDQRLWLLAEEAGELEEDSPRLVKYCPSCKIWDFYGSCC